MSSRCILDDVSQAEGCHFFESISVSVVRANIGYFEKNRSAPDTSCFFPRQLAKILASVRAIYRTAELSSLASYVRTRCSIWARYENGSQQLRAWDARRRLAFIEVPVEPVGGTRRRPGITAQISATPVQDLSPFPEPGQSALASHRPSRCEGGTAPELRFSTFLSRVYSRQLSVYSPFALSRTMFSRHHALSPHLRVPVPSFLFFFFFFCTDIVHTSRNTDGLPPTKATQDVDNLHGIIIQVSIVINKILPEIHTSHGGDFFLS